MTIIYVNNSANGTVSDDNFYIDNQADTVIEQENNGNDTVFSSVSYTLGANIENLTLTEALDPVKSQLNSQEVIIYGHITKWNLDFIQGSNDVNYFKDEEGNVHEGRFDGDCGIVSAENVLIMAGKLPESTETSYSGQIKDVQENELVQFAIDNDLCSTSSSNLGGTNAQNIVDILELKGVGAGSSWVWLATVEEKVKAGYGVILGLSLEVLNGGSGLLENHAVTVTGVVYDTADNLLGFYICDSGSGEDSQVRYVSKELLTSAVNVWGAFQIITDKPIQTWSNNIDGTGNDLANTITGNSGNNSLYGLGGNDIIYGGNGNDTIYGGDGNDTLSGGNGKDIIYGGAGNDLIFGFEDSTTLTEDSYTTIVNILYGDYKFLVGELKIVA